MTAPLSKRGLIASQTVLRKDFELFFQASQNLYNRKSNPEGAITLNIAENVLCWPILKKKIVRTSKKHDIPDWVSGYTSCLGHPSFREAMAGFMSSHLTKTTIDPERIAISAGATAVVEMTSWLLCDAGDVAVFPAPCYPVYTMDIGNKAGVERYDLQTHTGIHELGNGPTLKIEHLEKAKIEIEAQGKEFKMLVLTSPDNPTGGIYSIKKLNKIADWCITHTIHMVVNEIYGLSLIPSEKIKRPAIDSFASIIQEKKSDYLHLWYSLSKDLGISGFRIGVLYSLNSGLIAAYDNYNAPHMVSNHTQWIMQHILADRSFMKKYIKINQKRLGKSYRKVINSLEALAIPYAPASGSLFVWMDMSEFLEFHTPQGEDHLWREIYDKTGVLLTPGDGFGHQQKGLFRLVYSCVPGNHLKEALSRLNTYVQEKRVNA